MTKLGRAFRTVLIMLGLVSITGPVAAHFHTYWPQVQGCYGKPGETVKWHYFWGHPYEMIIYDAAKPEFFLKTPSGKIETLSPKEISLADQDSGKARRAFEVEYKPAAPGDYYLCLEGQPVFIPEEKVFWQDYVKEVWHVMAEKGWDQPAGLALEIIPLTRPYGWPAGSVFQGQARFMNKPLKNATVEIEKFNGVFVPKDKLPKDRLGEENTPFITRVTKTDAQGYLTCTLDSPGWWAVAVVHPHGKKTHEGKAYPVEKRGYIWVYVEPSGPVVSSQ